MMRRRALASLAGMGSVALADWGVFEVTTTGEVPSTHGADRRRSYPDRHKV
jgi:hypothetical protein